MRIAVWHNLPSGGGMRQLHDHVRMLVARGHAVEVWCPPTADRSHLPLNGLAAEHVLPGGPREAVPLRALARVGLRSDVAGRLRSMDVHCRQVAAEIGTRFDVLFANGSRSLRVTPLARYTQIPNVLYLNEPHRKLYEAQPELVWLDRNPVRRAAWRRLATEERRSAAAYDRLLVNSLFSRESVLRAYGIDATVCYLGVDTERFRPGGNRDCQRDGDHRDEQPEDRYVIGVGNFAPAKNIGFVLRALARVRPLPPRLVWVGNTAEADHLLELERLAGELGLRFEPRLAIGEDQLIAALQGAAALVYAPRLEPFGYAPLEANACGVPVVAVAEGGVRETVVGGVNGLVAAPDEEAFAEAVTRVLDDRALATDLSRQAREIVVERWSLDAAADRLEAQLESVVAAARRGRSSQT